MALRHVEGPDKEHLTREEVAQALRVSERHLRELIHGGKFPAGIPLGGTSALVWHWLDVVSFLHLSARLAAPPPPRKSTAEKSSKKSARNQAAPGGTEGH